MSSDTDKQVIACNLAVDKSHCSKGSLAYLLCFQGAGSLVLIRSRSGRWIKLWVQTKNLANFRLKTVVKDNSVYDKVYENKDYPLDAIGTWGAGQGLTLRP